MSHCFQSANFSYKICRRKLEHTTAKCWLKISGRYLIQNIAQIISECARQTQTSIIIIDQRVQSCIARTHEISPNLTGTQIISLVCSEESQTLRLGRVSHFTRDFSLRPPIILRLGKGGQIDF